MMIGSLASAVLGHQTVSPFTCKRRMKVGLILLTRSKWLDRLSFDVTRAQGGAQTRGIGTSYRMSGLPLNLPRDSHILARLQMWLDRLDGTISLPAFGVAVSTGQVTSPTTGISYRPHHFLEGVRP